MPAPALTFLSGHGATQRRHHRRDAARPEPAGAASPLGRPRRTVGLVQHRRSASLSDRTATPSVPRWAVIGARGYSCRRRAPLPDVAVRTGSATGEGGAVNTFLTYGGCAVNVRGTGGCCPKQLCMQEDGGAPAWP